jgi:hypothetical protein
MWLLQIIIAYLFKHCARNFSQCEHKTDMKVGLGLANKEMTADLFCVIFKLMEDDIAPSV